MASICVSGNHGDVAGFKRQRVGEERCRVRGALAKQDLEQAGTDLAIELAPWDEWASPRDGKQWLGREVVRAKQQGDLKRQTQLRRNLAK